MAGYPVASLGIDLGGTKILFGLFDEKFKLIDQVKEKTHPDKDEDNFTRTLEDGIKELVKKADKEGRHIAVVGVGAAGFLDEEKGLIVQSPNIPFFKNYPLRTRIRKILGLDAVLGNDSQLGLYGEHQLGAAKGLQNVIGIFLGTGIGGALVIDGRLYRGSTGTAGEIGHYLTDPMGPLAGSKRRGVLDNIVGRHAVAGEAAALAAKQWAPRLYASSGTSVEDIKSEDLAKAIRRGDRKVEELLRSRARILGIVLSNFADFLAPDMVLLGGGMVDAMPELICEEVRAGLRKFTIPPVARHVKVAASRLNGHAITAGAAKLAVDRAAQSRDAGL